MLTFGLIKTTVGRFSFSIILVLLVLRGVGFAVSVPVGFKTEIMAQGINAGTAVTVGPDGTVYFAEQTGHIRIIRNGLLLEKPLLDLSPRVDTHWERGLIGLQFHPEYPNQPYLFVVYVTKEPYTHHVISRFTIHGDAADLGSEKVLFTGDDQATLGGTQPGGHQGGPIRFGPDGKLYVGIGEQTEDAAAQSLKTIQGKILRLNADGTIPRDNPFYGRLEGKYQAIYAYGIRNPFGLAFQPNTGRLFEADIGKSSFDEINEIRAGGNYGWPLAEGFSDREGLINPIHAYPPAIGRSICGSVFYPASGNFPDEWKGKLFVTDWAAHWVKAIDVDHPETLLDFGTEFNNPVALDVAPDGALWVLNRGTRWRDGKVFANNSGNLVRISYVSGDYTESESINLPDLLSQAIAIEGMNPFRPSKDFTSFELNLPIWRPGVGQRNWIKMASSGRISVDSDGDWTFPEGTIFIYQFDDDAGEPFETHLYVSNGDGTYQASAYRWKADKSDAYLVERSEFIPLASNTTTMWFSPAPILRFDPKTAIFGFQPQLAPRQLNTGRQLADWAAKGWISESVGAERVSRLFSVDDGSVSNLERVRSYLDANCAFCHRPGGASRGYFDARFETPFAEQGLVSGQLMAGDLGVEGAELVKPGHPEQSVLYLRLARKDGFRMPPGTITDEDPPILPLLEKWIRELDTHP